MDDETMTIALYIGVLLIASAFGGMAVMAGIMQARAQNRLMAITELQTKILTARIALARGDSEPFEKLWAEKPEWDRRIFGNSCG